MASLSYYWKVNDKWDLLADVTWTGWDSIQQININRTTGAVLGVLPQNYKNTWRVSGVVNYQYNEKVILRMGVGTQREEMQKVVQVGLPVPLGVEA